MDLHFGNFYKTAETKNNLIINSAHSSRNLEMMMTMQLRGQERVGNESKCRKTCAIISQLRARHIHKYASSGKRAKCARAPCYSKRVEKEGG